MLDSLKKEKPAHLPVNGLLVDFVELKGLMSNFFASLIILVKSSINAASQ